MTLQIKMIATLHPWKWKSKYTMPCEEVSLKRCFVSEKLEINPGMKEGMLMYMIHIVLSDKIITKEEVELIYKFGNGIGLGDIEIATAIAKTIQQCYVPSLDAIFKAI